MLRRAFRLTAAAALLLGAAACGDGGNGDGEAAADEDLFAQGRQVFTRCAACHAAGHRENKVGPHLVGLFGRPAGGLPDFRYSEAMADAGIVWTEETLEAYLRAPRTYIPGNRMAFAGLRDEEDLRALMAYLRRVTAPEETPQ
jgi:cytochrome c